MIFMTTPSRTTAKPADDAAAKAREKAAAKATPRIAEVLRTGEKIKVAKLVQLVAQDAIEQQMDSLPDDEIKRIGDVVVAHGLLAGYTSARWKGGRWIGKTTGRAARQHFDALAKRQA